MGSLASMNLFFILWGPNGKKYKIYSPKYISISNRQVFRYNTYCLTQHNFVEAVLKQFKVLNESFDAI